MQLVWAVTHGLESASKRMHAELGITGPQRLVLRIVGHQGRISAGALADVLHIHPSSLTGMLQRLEQAELIRRESDPVTRTFVPALNMSGLIPFLVSCVTPCDSHTYSRVLPFSSVAAIWT